MTKLNRRSLIVGGFVAPTLTHALAFAAPVDWRGAAFFDVSQRAKRKVETGQVAGIAVGITTNGLRKSAYYGLSNRETKTLVSKNTLFRIASITKPIIATCILQLKEAGLLTLEQSIDAFFPAFPRADEVTIYHLLTHTSGIGNWWGRLPDKTPQGFMNLPDAHEWLAAMTPLYLFKPGTQRDYSNSGYLLLGQIIEDVAAMPLSNALERFVFSRVGAGLAGLETGMTRHKSWATGYAVENGRLVKAHNPPPPQAAGGIRSNLHDLLAFGDALFLGPLLEDGNLEHMTAHAVVADGRRVEEALYIAPDASSEPPIPGVTEMGYGLGINTWVQHGERFYSHSGLIDGFGAYFIHAPRTQTTAVLLSNTFGGTSDLHQIIRDWMIKAP